MLMFEPSLKEETNPTVRGPDGLPVRRVVIAEDPGASIEQRDVLEAWRQVQGNARYLSGKADYGVFLPNSNSFWATVLRMSGYDYRDFMPESPKIAPGAEADISDPHWWAPRNRWPGVKVPDERALP